jgi:hypothetical protein
MHSFYTDKITAACTVHVLWSYRKVAYKERRFYEMMSCGDLAFASDRLELFSKKMK